MRAAPYVNLRPIGWASTRSDYRSEHHVRGRVKLAPTSWRRGLAPRRNDADVHGSAAELTRRGAVRDIDVQTVLAYCGPRIEDPVRSVVRRGSRNADACSERQDCRIGCDDPLRHRDARRRNAAGAVRGRCKPSWRTRPHRHFGCRPLRYGRLRRRNLRWWRLRWRQLGWRCLGRGCRMNSVRTSADRQEQHRHSGVPSEGSDGRFHGVALPQTASRRRHTAKFSEISRSMVDARLRIDKFRRSDHELLHGRGGVQDLDPRA